MNAITLGAGTQPGNDERTGNGSASFFGTLDKDVVLAGQSVSRTEFLMDGMANVSLFTQTANITGSVEAVQELRTDTSGASARYSAPGTVSVIAKSGCNEIHGTLYDYLGNDALNARSFFSTSRGIVRSHDFGVNVGAPTVKNRLFAFFDYAGTRKSTASTKLARVPTDLERQEKFNSVVYDPSTCNAAAGTISAFPGNAIPSTLFNPSSVAFGPEPDRLHPVVEDLLGYAAQMPKRLFVYSQQRTRKLG